MLFELRDYRRGRRELDAGSNAVSGVVGSDDNVAVGWEKLRHGYT